MQQMENLVFWLFPSNPLTVREARERWRRPWGMVWLGIYAALLAVAGVYLYRQLVPAVTTAQVVPQFAPQVLGLGKTLFRHFATIQLLVWLALGVFLGAPALAIERQRGAVLDFFLAGLTPAQIVAAKWRSLAGFALVAMLCPLPVMSLCFVLGGVTPGEFVAFAVGIVTIGLASCALGLWLSVEQRDVSSALSAATVCTAWLVPVGGGLLAGLSGWAYFTPIAVLIGIGAALWLLHKTRDRLTAICMRLGEEAAPARRFEARVMFHSSFGAEPFTARFDASLEDYEADDFVLPTLLGPGGRFVPPPATVQTKVEVAGRHDIELSAWENQLSRLVAANPVAWRTWRSYLATTSRFDDEKRQPHPARPALLIGAALFCFGVIYDLELLWRACLLMENWILSGLVIAQLAPSFAREREAGTLEPLALTALLPAEIVRGKIGAALVAAMRLGFWPLVALAVWGLAGNWLHLILLLWLCAAHLVCAGALAAWASLRCRQASVAANVCRGALAFFWGFALVLPFSPGSLWEMLWLQPVRAVFSVGGPNALQSTQLAGYFSLAALVSLWAAQRDLGRSFGRR